MAGRQSGSPIYYDTSDPIRLIRRVGRFCRLVGPIVAAASLIVLVSALPFLAAPSTAGTASILVSVMSANASVLSGAALLFHVAALTALAGCWLLGLGLLLGGLFDRTG